MEPDVNSQDVNEKEDLQEQSIGSDNGVESSDKKAKSNEPEKGGVKKDLVVPHKNIELDTGDLKVRIRSRWWQFWYVCFLRKREPRIYCTWRLPKHPPPPPPDNLYDVPVSSNTRS